MDANPWDVITAALRDARYVDDAIKRHASAMARFLAGRLRSADPSDLRALKRELRDFDMTTGRWKR